MKNKYIKIGVLVFVVILFVGCCKRIAEVKRMYPQSSTVEVKFNTEYKDDNGISYKVKNVEYMSEREFIDKYGTNFDVPGDREQKILLVDMMLSNSNIVEAEYELSNFYIESSCYVNGVCLDSFGEMNNCFCLSISVRNCSSVGKNVLYFAAKSCSLPLRIEYLAISLLVSEHNTMPMVGLSPSVRFSSSYIRTYISICPTS